MLVVNGTTKDGCGGVTESATNDKLSELLRYDSYYVEITF
jgi:hypothetical protein